MFSVAFIGIPGISRITIRGELGEVYAKIPTDGLWGAVSSPYRGRILRQGVCPPKKNSKILHTLWGSWGLSLVPPHPPLCYASVSGIV